MLAWFQNYHRTEVTLDWDQPYTFFNQVYSVTGEEGRSQRYINGTAGTFLNMWYMDISN